MLRTTKHGQNVIFSYRRDFQNRQRGDHETLPQFDFVQRRRQAQASAPLNLKGKYSYFRTAHSILRGDNYRSEQHGMITLFRCVSYTITRFSAAAPGIEGGPNDLPTIYCETKSRKQHTTLSSACPRSQMKYNLPFSSCLNIHTAEVPTAVV